MDERGRLIGGLPLRSVIVGQEPPIPSLRGRALRTSVTLIPPLRYGTALRAGAPIPSPENTVCSRTKVGVNFGAWEKFQTLKLALKLNF